MFGSQFGILLNRIWLLLADGKIFREEMLKKGLEKVGVKINSDIDLKPFWVESFYLTFFA